MNRHVYNGCMLGGLGLATAGTALVSIPAALIVAGGLLIGITAVTALVTRAG